ncbi:MAG: glycosyltransferase family 2 protein [Candidatus Omnitrophica bacterium]|nr:glycosyltransferase family 2 protein [Candidatus Omnitrophota bacterium]
MAKCKTLELAGCDKRTDQLWHAVIFPAFRETESTLAPSIEALIRSHYPLKRIIVVLAIEDRGGEAVWKAAHQMKAEYESHFADFLVYVHPDGLPGEFKTKGANITWAGRKLKEYFDERKIAYDDVLISCFDSDTRVNHNYFSCLTYQYLANPKRTRASYQPVPVYHNNIWEAKSFARVIEITSSFWQLVEGMKREKFVSFSSHSLSMKALVDVDFWPVDMISDDSAIFWRCYIHYHGDYHVVPMYVTVSMDIATAPTIWGTIKNQYKQKRRWAWGVENFPVMMMAFRKDTKISFIEKLRRSTQILGEHFTWATWAIVIGWISPLPILFRDYLFSQSIIGYQFPSITGTLLNLTGFSIIICILISFALLPHKPANVRRVQIVKMFTQWLFTPVITLVIASLPTLDAQTRLMTGKYLGVLVTPKAGG